MFQFYPNLLLKDSAVDINGKFSEDLDLFYTAESIRSLFSYKDKAYRTVCKLAVEILEEAKKD